MAIQSRKSKTDHALAARRRRTPEKPAFSADHYRKLRENLNDVFKVKKKHSPSTANNINDISERWLRFCQNIEEEDPIRHLQNASRDDVMLFLRWNLDNYPSRKRISIRQKFKHWRQLYRKFADRDFDEEWRKEVNDHINGSLADEYELDMVAKDKPVVNIDDVFTILHHHWALDTSTFPDARQLLQLALLLLICAYTATRPGALVYVKRNNKVLSKCALQSHKDDMEADDASDNDDNDVEMSDDNTPPSPEEVVECLCYKHVSLMLLPNPDGERDLLAMEIDLRYTKGHKRNARKKIFCMYEVDDLIFDPVLLMVSVGLLDKAFEVDFASAEQLFQLRVNSNRRSMRLRWKKEWEDRPIFRQAVPTPMGHRTSDSLPLRYHTMLYYLQRLGFMVGMMMILNPYTIRRGAGEGVQDVASQAQLQQVMGHKDAGIFQAYINERVQCDVQAAFLGRPSADALFKSLGHMSRDIDPRAPTQLTASDIDALKVHPLIIELRERRDVLSHEIQRTHKTLKQAEASGDPTFELYRHAAMDLESAKKRLKRGRLRETRADFFDKIETADAQNQLGLATPPPQAEEEKPQKAQLSAERKHVADLLCERIDGLDEAAKLRHRISTIDALLALCDARGALNAPRKAPVCGGGREWGVLPEARQQQPYDFIKVMSPSRSPSPPPPPQQHPVTIKMESPPPPVASVFYPTPSPPPSFAPAPTSTFEPILLTNKQCLFCAVTKSSLKPFSRRNKALTHLQNQHLSHFAADSWIPCPDAYCRAANTSLRGHVAFREHVATVHQAPVLPPSAQMQPMVVAAARGATPAPEYGCFVARPQRVVANPVPGQMFGCMQGVAPGGGICFVNS